MTATLKNLQLELKPIKEELKYVTEELKDVKEELKEVKEELKDVKNEWLRNVNIQNTPIMEDVSSIIECTICELSFGSKKSLKQHAQSTHPRKIKCKLCQSTFDKNCNLEEHMKTSHEERENFECEECGKTFVLQWRLRKHKENHASENDKIGCMFSHTLPETCIYGNGCNNTLCSYQHEKYLPKKSYQLFNVSYKCSECDAELQSINSLEAHKETYHSKENEIELEKFKDISDNIGDKVAHITWCEVCEYDYNYEELEEHEVDCHDTSFYQKCGRCTFAINNDSKIIRHRKTHYNK